MRRALSVSIGGSSVKPRSAERKPQVVILGCGYTGERVSRRLLEQGYRVLATSHRPERLVALGRAGAKIERLDVDHPGSITAALAAVEPGARVLHSIPVIRAEDGPFDPTPRLLEALGARPARLVYLSTTAVYGDTFEVDETTPASPRDLRGRLRLAAERAVAAGPWSWLVLRPAAIYGPGRGVHESIRQGRFRLAGDGANYVSRIHVEDLAAIVEAALASSLTGFYPVADAEPSTARRMAEFCASLLGLPLPSSAPAAEAHPSRRANRKVDGSAICRLLGVELKYPSYRVGVPASL